MGTQRIGEDREKRGCFGEVIRLHRLALYLCSRTAYLVRGKQPQEEARERLVAVKGAPVSADAGQARALGARHEAPSHTGSPSEETEHAHHNGGPAPEADFRRPSDCGSSTVFLRVGARWFFLFRRTLSS